MSEFRFATNDLTENPCSQCSRFGNPIRFGFSYQICGLYECDLVLLEQPVDLQFDTLYPALSHLLCVEEDKNRAKTTPKIHQINFSSETMCMERTFLNGERHNRQKLDFYCWR